MNENRFKSAWRRTRKTACAVFAFAHFLASGAPAQVPDLSASSALREHDVKAGFIYQFAQFVEWPEEAAGAEESFVFCVGGENPFGGTLDVFEREEIRGRKVDVRYFGKAREAEGCHVLFVSGRDEDEAGKTLGKLSGRPVLTIGEQSGFLDAGGIVNFVQEGSRIRFEINRAKAEEAGLKVSSKLLSLAKRVVP